MTAAVYAVANQKGGVAKTTTVLSLGAALAEHKRAVLLVDLDPQACLTFSLGYDPDRIEPTIHDVVAGRVRLVDTVRQHPMADLVPADIDLAGAQVTLLSRAGREYLLRGQLVELLDSYDLVLLDCPPSLGVLTINGLTAADEVLIPVQCEALSHRGVSQLLETIQDVRRLTNRDLAIRGVIATLFDARTNHSRDVLADMIGRYALPLVGPPVRKSIRFAEAPTEGRSILEHARRTPGAAAYRAIARELIGLPVDEELLAAAGWAGDLRGRVFNAPERPSAHTTRPADLRADDEHGSSAEAVDGRIQVEGRQS